MKFCKKYEEYMQVQKKTKNLPGVGFKKLKKILKKCRRNHVPSSSRFSISDNNCPRECPGTVQHNSPEKCSVSLLSFENQCCVAVCDGTFFPELLSEMEIVVGWFNENAKKLLELHLASGFTKCITWFKGNTRKKNHLGLIQEGQDLVNYALINAVAIRKILKKYDKIHESRQGQAFKTQVQKMRIEILQSPWLCELMAFHINLKESKKEPGAVVSAAPSSFPVLFDGCSLTFDDGKPLLSCVLSDSVKVDIDLTCSICLVRNPQRISLSKVDLVGILRYTRKYQPIRIESLALLCQSAIPLSSCIFHFKDLSLLFASY